MRLADMHIHTTFSPDGKSSMEEQCNKDFPNSMSLDEINEEINKARNGEGET